MTLPEIDLVLELHPGLTARVRISPVSHNGLVVREDRARILVETTVTEYYSVLPLNMFRATEVDGAAMSIPAAPLTLQRAKEKSSQENEMLRSQRLLSVPCFFSHLSIGFFTTLLVLASTAILSSAQTFTTLANFNSASGNGPTGALVQSTDGNLYGTTINGGSAGNFQCHLNGCGTVYKVSTGGTLTHLYSFCSQPNCADGAFPRGGLVQGGQGNFYGTTSGGGTGCHSQIGCGTVFKITPTGALTTLYSFCSQPDCADGYSPAGKMVLASDGNLYGTAQQGGANGAGVIFRITPAGTLSVFYNFCSLAGCADGTQPIAGIMQAADGNLYGTTALGGSSDGGTVFRITLGGSFTTMHSFSGNDGLSPVAELVQAADGNLYGTTEAGGDINNPNCPSDGCGTVFKINLGAALTTLYRFAGPDGYLPGSALIQATDGILYGNTWGGGVNGDFGTVFKITAGGTLTTLHSFNGFDGEAPSGPPLQVTDGNIYGTSGAGGTSNYGTFFSLNAGLSPFIETQPTSGNPLTPVTILGTNLSGATLVDFATANASFQIISPTEIQTHVPYGAATGSVHVTMPSGQLTSNANFQVTGALQYIAPGGPCRLVDTRQTGGPIQAGTSRDFSIPRLTTCGIPAAAAAYALNVTVIPHGPLAYLTVWPQGNVQPFVSTMNSLDGRIKANAVIVLGGNEAVSIYASNTTDVILDLEGYFMLPDVQSLQFYPLTPCRVADTRNSSFPAGLGTPHLSAGVARDFPVLTSSCIPSNISAAAYSFNFTAIPYPSLGNPLAYLEVWPTGFESQHRVSTLNNPTGTYVANAAIVSPGTDGKIRAFASDDTDLAIDINGYFAAPGTGGLSLYSTAPCRVFDSRTVGGGQPFSGTLSPPVDVVDSPCGVPSTAQAYVFNATVVPSPNLSYLTLWPDSEGQPVVSTLNAADGWITSNMAIVPNVNGKIDAYAAGMTQLILDISSYFAP